MTLLAIVWCVGPQCYGSHPWEECFRSVVGWGGLEKEASEAQWEWTTEGSRWGGARPKNRPRDWCLGWRSGAGKETVVKMWDLKTWNLETETLWSNLKGPGWPSHRGWKIICLRHEKQWDQNMDSVEISGDTGSRSGSKKKIYWHFESTNCSTTISSHKLPLTCQQEEPRDLLWKKNSLSV